MTGSGRQRARLERDLRRESIIGPNPALGLVTMNGPNDPEPSLIVRGGEVVELDGRTSSEFDLIDRFINANGLDVDIGIEAMQLEDLALARQLVDIHVSRQELTRLARGFDPRQAGTGRFGAGSG